jgi:sulfur-oxidizing protein SoxX
MQYKNLIFFMLLYELRRLAAGIAAIAVLAGVAAHAGTADGITAGKSLAMERNKGNCLACHRIEDGELPGTIGPIRNPDSRMPPFCRHGILTEDEVELIVDYLYTL